MQKSFAVFPQSDYFCSVNKITDLFARPVAGAKECEQGVQWRVDGKCDGDSAVHTAVSAKSSGLRESGKRVG